MPELSDVERIERLEQGVFGFFDEQKNAYVPGVMQIVADSATQLKQIKYVLISAVIIAAGSNPSLWHMLQSVLFK